MGGAVRGGGGRYDVVRTLRPPPKGYFFQRHFSMGYFPPIPAHGHGHAAGLGLVCERRKLASHDGGNLGVLRGQGGIETLGIKAGGMETVRCRRRRPGENGENDQQIDRNAAPKAPQRGAILMPHYGSLFLPSTTPGVRIMHHGRNIIKNKHVSKTLKGDD
eukprot:gene10171-biopygen7743